MRCCGRILEVCWQNKVRNKIVRGKVESLYNSRLDMADETESIRALLQDERRMTVMPGMVEGD